MHRTIFYSWQSDLPNNSNRAFIESAIKKAISQLRNEGPFALELAIDRDTKKVPGTPEIVSTIFDKIDSSCLFIADISIINPKSKARKTPNPNVLLELGYAAKSIGWDRIICIYNSDLGSYDDLPFDLRQRRPLEYSLKGKTKSKEKDLVVRAISETVLELNKRGRLFDELQDYFKVQVDTEILTSINHLSKILFGYEPSLGSLAHVKNFLNLSEEEINEKLGKREFMGFQVYKKLETNESNFRRILDSAISSAHYKRELAIPIINIIHWLGSFDKFNRSRQSPDLFIDKGVQSKGYVVVSGREMNPQLNTQFPDRYILLQKIEHKSGLVLDFGDFVEKHKKDRLLNLLQINSDYLRFYSAKIAEFIKYVDNWLDLTNGEFIIENIKAFEIRPLPNNSL